MRERELSVWAQVSQCIAWGGMGTHDVRESSNKIIHPLCLWIYKVKNKLAIEIKH